MKVVDFAKSQGYEGAVYLGKWKGFEVYEPTFNEPTVIGLPYMILVDGDDIRMSTEAESFECLDRFF